MWFRHWLIWHTISNMIDYVFYGRKTKTKISTSKKSRIDIILNDYILGGINAFFKKFIMVNSSIFAIADLSNIYIYNL